MITLASKRAKRFILMIARKAYIFIEGLCFKFSTKPIFEAKTIDNTKSPKTKLTFFLNVFMFNHLTLHQIYSHL